MHHVILGAGPAGVTAADTLRRTDPDCRITLLGDEPGPPYARMAIPYLLAERIEATGTRLRRDPGHYRNQRIEVIHDRAVGLEPAAHRLRLAGGDHLVYDRLLIATGSHPAPPPLIRPEEAPVFPCWTLEDARAIATRAHRGARVVLIGAGFIGCILMESLLLRRVRLSVVETGDRMVPRMLDATAGGLLRDWCRTKGVDVRTSTRVEAIHNRADGGAQLVLTPSGTLEADLIITATGVRPNMDFLTGSGVHRDQGILVDRRMCANLPHIYAAGDVAQGRDFGSGERQVQAIQPTAVEHGRIAALNMAGRDALHGGGLNMNVLDTLGLVSTSFGLTGTGTGTGPDPGETATLCDPDRYRYLQLRFRDDLLVGASSLGLSEQVGVLRGLIQSRLPLGKWAAVLRRDPTRFAEAYVGLTQRL